MSCPECFTGTVHEGAPKGRVEEVYGRKTYISEPIDGSEVKGLIVIVPDAFGWEFNNNRLLADHYAEKGHYKVFLPDFMDGRPAPEWMINVFPALFSTGSIGAWASKPYWIVQAARGFIPFMYWNRFPLSYPKVTSFLREARSANSALPIGVAGFCWGGKHVITLGHDEEKLVDAVFTGHPSALDIPGDLEKVKLPVSIALGDNDNVVPMTQVEGIKQAFNSKKDVATEVVIYPGAGHGFCVRADPGNKVVDQQSKDAEDQAIAWFGKYLNKH